VVASELKLSLEVMLQYRYLDYHLHQASAFEHPFINGEIQKLVEEGAAYS